MKIQRIIFYCLVICATGSGLALGFDNPSNDTKPSGIARSRPLDHNVKKPQSGLRPDMRPEALRRALAAMAGAAVGGLLIGLGFLHRRTIAPPRPIPLRHPKTRRSSNATESRARHKARSKG